VTSELAELVSDVDVDDVDSFGFDNASLTSPLR
jgi:hypothetical protein